MTTFSAAALHEEHAHLHAEVDHMREAARELPRLSPDERAAIVSRILDFLRGTLLPHAEAEEADLYAEVGRLLGNARAIEPMIHDHRAIKRLIDALGRAPTDPPDELQELLYGLATLIDVHFEKEEEIYLPLLEREHAH